MKMGFNLFLGGIRRGKLIGTVIESYDLRMKGWINRLAVAPAYQGKRIAKELLTRMEKN